MVSDDAQGRLAYPSAREESRDQPWAMRPRVHPVLGSASQIAGAVRYQWHSDPFVPAWQTGYAVIVA